MKCGTLSLSRLEDKRVLPSVLLCIFKLNLGIHICFSYYVNRFHIPLFIAAMPKLKNLEREENGAM